MSLRKKILFPLLLVLSGSAHVGCRDQVSETNSGKNSETEDVSKTEKTQILDLSEFASIFEKVKDRVVSVVVTQNHSEENEDISKLFSGTPLEDVFKNFTDPDEKTNHKVHVAGSGFFIQKDQDTAYIVTNCHIVENAVKARIFLNDKTEVPAIIHGSDSRSDLAVLKIKMKDVPENKRKSIGVMEWGDSDTTKVGHWVLAIGNPFGLGNTVTHGIISAKSRDLPIGNNGNDDFIQHSAQINVGNSGGCLLDTHGKVIGINTLIVTPSKGNVGIGFAIPSNTARRVIQKLIEKQKVQRGALGIKVQDFTQEMAESLGIKKYEQGALVAFVDPKGPSVEAGLKEGDVILQFDDTEITGSKKLSRVVGDAQSKTSHQLKIIRNGEGKGSEKMVEMTLDVMLVDYDEINKTKNSSSNQAKDKVVEILGMSLMNAKENNESGSPAAAKSGGVFIVKIAPDSVAEEVGLARGDAIEEINQKKITSVDSFKDEIIKAQKAQKRNVFIRVRKGETIHYVALKIDNSDAPESPIENRSEDVLKELDQQPRDMQDPRSTPEESDAKERPTTRKKTKNLTKKMLKGFENFGSSLDDFFKRHKGVVDESSQPKNFYR